MATGRCGLCSFICWLQSRLCRSGRRSSPRYPRGSSSPGAQIAMLPPLSVTTQALSMIRLLSTRACICDLQLPWLLRCTPTSASSNTTSTICTERWLWSASVLVFSDHAEVGFTLGATDTLTAYLQIQCCRCSSSPRKKLSELSPHRAPRRMTYNISLPKGKPNEPYEVAPLMTPKSITPWGQTPLHHMEQLEIVEC